MHLDPLILRFRRTILKWLQSMLRHEWLDLNMTLSSSLNLPPLVNLTNSEKFGTYCRKWLKIVKDMIDSIYQNKFVNTLKKERVQTMKEFDKAIENKIGLSLQICNSLKWMLTNCPYSEILPQMNLSMLSFTTCTEEELLNNVFSTLKCWQKTFEKLGSSFKSNLETNSTSDKWRISISNHPLMMSSEKLCLCYSKKTLIWMWMNRLCAEILMSISGSVLREYHSKLQLEKLSFESFKWRHLIWANLTLMKMEPNHLTISKCWFFHSSSKML